MAQSVYASKTEAAVPLVATVAKSVIGVAGTADFGVNLKKFRISFDGITATAVPVLIELCYATFATNAPGTASTTTTPRQTSGRVLAAGFTSAANWSAEPTVLTALEEWLLTPNGGLVLYDFPLGDEPDSAFSQGFVLRCTAPAVVNLRSTVWYSRC